MGWFFEDHSGVGPRGALWLGAWGFRGVGGFGCSLWGVMGFRM